MRTTTLAGLVALSTTGCYVGVRAGPSLLRAEGRAADEVGWMIGAFGGMELTMFERVRLAAGGDALATFHGASDGTVVTHPNSLAARVDVTVRQRYRWTRTPAGCPTQRGGWRVRSGLGARIAGSRANALEVVPTSGAREVTGGKGFVGLEANVEAGGWMHNSSLFFGAGVTAGRMTLADDSTVETLGAYAQLTFSTAGPLKSAGILLSNTWAIEAERQRQAWASIDCSGRADGGECERTRTEQIAAWSAREQDEQARAVRQRAELSCL